MFHLTIWHGWLGHEKTEVIGQSFDIEDLRADYLIAKSMGQNPEIWSGGFVAPGKVKIDVEALEVHFQTYE